MYSNQQPSSYITRQYTFDSQSSSKNNNDLSYDRPHPTPAYPNDTNAQPATYFNDRSNFGQQQSSYGSPPTMINYVPPNTNRYPTTRSGSSSAIDKTNMMSSENPFCDPARPYEQLNSARTITSITSPPKNGSGINKSNNLSDANPFNTTYSSYRYPSQIDPSKRITSQSTFIRSTDNKSLNLSDANPFYPTYGHYHYPSQIDPQKRITELPKPAGPLVPKIDLSDNNSFSNYRPSPIREYSSGSGEVSAFPTSISDWTRNNPAPLSYRPIQVQRPPPDYYTQSESSNTSSYIPPVSPPRQKRQPSLSPPPRVQSQKATSSAPSGKTSLNMSPDNPFAEAYGRYHYPSNEEVKAQKKTSERSTRFIEQPPINENRPTQTTTANSMIEYPEVEKKEMTSGKGNTNFARFDVTF